MKIAILGAGFTGLTAALKLAQQGHDVTVFEKEGQVGGLASGIKDPTWSWYLDRTYHHLFTNDKKAIDLAKIVGQKLVRKRPKTNVFVEGKALPFDSPLALLKFPYLPLSDRLRTGTVLFYLRYLSNLSILSKTPALPWLKKAMGEKSTGLVWEPLFLGKFGKLKNDIALIWFWARIKKRTPSLFYPEGGFQQFAQKLAGQVEKQSGKIVLKSEIIELDNNLNSYKIKTSHRTFEADKILCTLPTEVFLKIAHQLPRSYQTSLSSISHLAALNLILVLNQPFFKDQTYWLNITDKSFPFLVLAEHTNFMDSKEYGNQHILYIGNYLPPDHPYLKKSADELLKIFDPYLKKINPSYHLSLITYHLFLPPNAQPVVTPDYQDHLPTIQTPLKNLYLANLDMVYPWDRGVNYAIELGQKAAKLIAEKHA